MPRRRSFLAGRRLAKGSTATDRRSLINYNGGFVRAARVARLAREQRMPISPHETQAGPDPGNEIDPDIQLQAERVTL